MSNIIVYITIKKLYSSKEISMSLNVPITSKCIHILYDYIKLSFDITFNGFDNCDVKSNEDIKSITLSQTHTELTLHNKKLEKRYKLDGIIYQREKEIKNLSEECSSLTLNGNIDFLDENSEKSISKIVEDIKIILMQIANHKIEINKIRNANYEIIHEKNINVYSIEIFRCVNQNIESYSFPKQNDLLKIFWTVNNDNISSSVVKETIESHNLSTFLSFNDLGYINKEINEGNKINETKPTFTSGLISNENEIIANFNNINNNNIEYVPYNKNSYADY